MLTIYLIKGFPEYAATSLSDAQSLYTALQDPSTTANSATIDRVAQKLPPFVQSDNGEALVLSSVDDANGNISSWVTSATDTIAFAIGDPSATTDLAYTVANVSTIAGNTRTGTLALNTDRLQCAVSGSFGRPTRGASPQFLAHIRKANTLTGYTETLARLPVQVLPGVLTATTQQEDQANISLAGDYASQAHAWANLANTAYANANTAATNANTYAFASLGYSQDSQNYANWSRANANLSNGFAITAAAANTNANLFAFNANLSAFNANLSAFNANLSAFNANANATAAASSAGTASTAATAAQANANIAVAYATPATTTVLTPGANVSWNMAANVTASLIANQNFNLTITAFADGGTGLLHIKQNASGNWVASSWSVTGGNIAWPGNVNPTLTATANYFDEFSFVAHGTTIRGAYVQGYAL